MSKVLIDRELLERAVYGLELAYETDTPTVRDICAVLAAPSGTPAMPVKAYYHEAPNEYGGLNKSVGLEVRKEFADAPLVLEADAMARIACLEGEIAKRDEELAACRIAVENCEVFRARIVELEEKTSTAMGVGSGSGNLFVYGDHDSIKAAQKIVIEHDQFRAELDAIKAQEPVGFAITDNDTGKLLPHAAFFMNRAKAEKLAALTGGCSVAPLYAAPVSEAKAQGVVQCPEADEIMQMAFEEGQPADDASGYCFELEEFDLFIERLMSEVARLNAAPVQQVSVPDGWRVERGYSPSGYVLHSPSGSMIRVCDSGGGGIETAFALFLKAMLAAAPAAPAADAWIQVSERLPGEDDQVLCWCEDETVAWAEVSSHHNSFFTDMTHELLPVTHWMPLPAGPVAHHAKGVV